MSRWFRVYDDLVDDPKVQRLSADLFRALVNLWCLASKNGGKLPSLADMAFKLRIREDRLEKMLGELRECGLLDGDEPHNWSGRQYKSDDSSERVARYRNKRRDAGLPALGDYSKFKPALINRDGEKCVYCLATDSLVVDHMVPIAMGGTDDHNNLALACKRCNGGKAGRTPELAGMSILVSSAAMALGLYRDSRRTVTVTVTPPETDTEPETDKQDDEVAREPLISEASNKLADEIALIVGHDLAFVPPAWCGASYTTQKWLNANWPREIILASIREQMQRRKGDPPDRITYFEKGIAGAVARHNAPLPAAKIIPGETINVRANAGSGSVIDAARAIRQRIEDSADSEADRGSILRLPPR